MCISEKRKKDRRELGKLNRDARERVYNVR